MSTHLSVVQVVGRHLQDAEGDHAGSIKSDTAQTFFLTNSYIHTQCINI